MPYQADSQTFAVASKQQSELPSKLISHDSDDEFIPIFEFEDSQMAMDYAQCVSKAVRYHLPWQRDRFVRVAKALLAVKGKRASLFGQTISRMPEISIGSKRSGGGQNNSSPAAPNV